MEPNLKEGGKQIKKTYTEEYEKSFKKFEREIDKLHSMIMSAAEDAGPEASAELANLDKESLYQSTVAFLLPKAVWYLAHICDKLDALDLSLVTNGLSIQEQKYIKNDTATLEFLKNLMEENDGE